MVGSDLIPEHTDYSDGGCELFPYCLNCPFPHCVYDEPRGKQRRKKELRNRQILKAYGDGAGVGEIARRFGVSRRTIQRALKASRSGIAI